MPQMIEDTEQKYKLTSESHRHNSFQISIQIFKTSQIHKQSHLVEYIKRPAAVSLLLSVVIVLYYSIGGN